MFILAACFLGKDMTVSVCKTLNQYFYLNHSQPVFTCSKLTIETLQRGAKYVQSQQ